jgi:hypothetical protein
LYYYGRQGTSFDPRLQSEDLGDNAMLAGTYGIANLKRILPNIETWTFQKGESYDDLAELYGEVITQFTRYMGHVATNIGGMNENFKTYDQSGPVYDFVAKSRQHDAALFFNKQLFTTPSWLINSSELSKFDDGLVVNRIKGIQTSLLAYVLTPPRLSRMYDNEVKNGTNAYTVADLFTDLRAGVFAPDNKPDAFKRNLQRAYIEDLKSLLYDDYKGIPGLPQGFLAYIGLTPINLTLADIRPMVRVELKNIDTGLPKGGDEMAKAHYADLHARIKEALNPTRPVVNITATATRSFMDDLLPEENMEPAN